MWARLAHPRPRDERGSALVEAAIILPVIVLLTFGTIDFGIGFNQKAGLDNAARSGTRLAATDTTADNPAPVVVPGPGGGTYAANTQIGYDAGTAVNAALSQLASKPELKFLFVYRIDGPTLAPNVVTKSSDCAADRGPTGDPACIQYVPNANGSQFDLFNTGSTGTWPLGTSNVNRSACVVQADRVGVTIVGNFHFLSGVVGTTVTLTAKAAAQLEPTNC